MRIPRKLWGIMLSENLTTEGSLLALKKAINTTELKELSLIHHSDRGLQYCSDEYQKF